jgi:hypothetical protein
MRCQVVFDNWHSLHLWKRHPCTLTVWKQLMDWHVTCVGSCIVTAICVFINPIKLYWISTINKYFNIGWVTFWSSCIYEYYPKYWYIFTDCLWLWTSSSHQYDLAAYSEIPLSIQLEFWLFFVVFLGSWRQILGQKLKVGHDSFSKTVFRITVNGCYNTYAADKTFWNNPIIHKFTYSLFTEDFDVLTLLIDMCYTNK